MFIIAILVIVVITSVGHLKQQSSVTSNILKDKGPLPC